MVSQPLGRRLRRFLFYRILIFVLIITASWLRTTTTYVSVYEYTFVRAISVTSFVPADVYSQHLKILRCWERLRVRSDALTF